MGKWFVLIPTVSLRLPLWGLQVSAVHGIWASFLRCRHVDSKRYPAQQLIKTLTYPISQLTSNLHQTMAKCTNPHNEYVSNRLKLAYMWPSSRRRIYKQDPCVPAVELYWWSLLCCRWLICTSRSQLHCVITYVTEMWKMALFLGSIFHLQNAKLKRLEPEVKETLLKPT